MTWAEVAAAWLVILAAALAVDRAMISRAHWPIAAVLCLAMLEPLRPDEGTVAKLLCLALPALSAWLAVRVLARARLLAACAAALVFAVGAWRWSIDWSTAPVWASAASVITQALALLGVTRYLWLSDRCVLVLFFGDVAALFGPLGERSTPPVKTATWWVVQWQAAAVAAVLCLLHVHQALADRRRRG